MADPGYRWSDGHPQRRAAWERRLRTIGPVACGCQGECLTHVGQCTEIITADDDWHLGHGVAVAHGGDGSDSVPWSSLCNHRAAPAKTNNPTKASRHWWG